VIDEIMNKLQENFPLLEIIPEDTLESSRTNKYKRESSLKKLKNPG